jgi:hypothetical protein
MSASGCTKRTCRSGRCMSVIGGKTEVGLRGRQVSFLTHFGHGAMSDLSLQRAPEGTLADFAR